MSELQRSQAPETTEWELFERAVARLRARAVAVVAGLFCGTGLFVATIWLVIQGGPNVGQHLALLDNYFPGYTVTWGGAFVGFFYGAIAGAVGGWCTAWFYNRIASMRDPG